MPYRLAETAGRCFENKPHLSSSDTPYVELLLSSVSAYPGIFSLLLLVLPNSELS